MITIKKATLKDLVAIRNLNQELFEDSFKFDKELNMNWTSKNKKYYKKAITAKDKISFIAIFGGKIVGYLIASIQKVEAYRTIGKIAELENILVKKEFRSMGIGGLLVKEFFKWAKLKRLKKARVSAYAESNEAVEFYKRNDFVNYSLVLETDIK